MLLKQCCHLNKHRKRSDLPAKTVFTSALKMYYFMLISAAALVPVSSTNQPGHIQSKVYNIAVESASLSCNTLEQTAATSTPPSDPQLASGTFALTSTPFSCGGVATQWRVCYYRSITDPSTTTTFGVYRPTQPPGKMYTMIGDATWYITSEGTSNFSCSNMSVNYPFVVKQGDIIVVCILSTASGHLGAAANLLGASVLQMQAPCTTLPTTINLSADFISKSDLTLFVNLDIKGCDANGYLLDSNGLNCTTSSDSSGIQSSMAQGTTSISEHTTTPAIVASVIVIVALLAVVTATVATIVVLYKIKNRRNSQMATTATAATGKDGNGISLYKAKVQPPIELDNVVYHAPVNTNEANIIVRSNGVTCDQEILQRSEQTNQIIENGTNIYATLCQQVSYEHAEVYEDPYYLPSLREDELYAQLENHEIKKIPRHEIKTTVMLGNGQFGEVEIGIWSSYEKRREVAIKTLNPSSTKPEDKVKFLQEAAIMAQFRHPNVIQFYGIVTDGEPIMLVLELAENKDLRTHLFSLKPKQLVRPDLPKILLAYSKQVALGMQYLSSKSFVHCDLAARNVLVTKDYVCKVADFGLSHNLADENYYVTHGGVIPIKWTAPEAINFKKYSTASDVWSYGCLLYEIWTLGCKPFEGLSNAEAIEKIENGYRLPPPPGCPQMLYQIMINCWNPETHSRPAFKEIYATLTLHETAVLVIPNEAFLTHPQAGLLGAPLKAGENMYLDLQKSYI